MREIPLVGGKVALVDDNNYDQLLKFKWYYVDHKYTFYAMRHPGTVYMHRELLKHCLNMEIDHIDGNGLNNQKSNLRVVTTRQNLQNLHVPKTSKYPGVSWMRHNSRWVAQIRVNNVNKYIGVFKNEHDAAIAYKIACITLGFEI
jgi:hypothetical protein